MECVSSSHLAHCNSDVVNVDKPIFFNSVRSRSVYFYHMSTRLFGGMVPSYDCVGDGNEGNINGINSGYTNHE